MYFDTHCHLNSEDFNADIDDVIERASEAKVQVIDIATQIESSNRSIELSKKYPNKVYATVGYHPEEATGLNNRGDRLLKSVLNDLKDNLVSIIESNSIVGVGECGLDYFWLKKDNKYSQKETTEIISGQQDIFRIQCEIAKEFNFPLIIHTRAMEEDSVQIIDDALDILERTGNPRGIFHSFTGKFEQAERFLSKGYFISFNGIVTFKKSYEMREMMKKCFEKYSNQILLETDGPYLAPEGKRGQRNEPANVKLVYELLEEVLKTKCEKLIEQNVNQIFRLI